MPIYEFTCEQCGKNLELLVPFSKIPSVCGNHCGLTADQPGAGQGRLKRLMSRPAAVKDPESIGQSSPTTKKMGDAGFTVYKKEDAATGTYRKQSGSGPDTIQR